MRGKVDFLNLKLLHLRITPASAGKRIRKDYEINANKDHPRECGEKELAKFHTVFRLGSPPRVRGKGAPFAKQGLDFRITPASAGKSSEFTV